ncbi:hypothetical protein Y032_0632g877 [Ancylostoma ceylanicum]|uniref:Uncharacterized protein n=2 Tax=Ancylostoma ceylanicum TaxID=53326 RepID=A0A016WKD0_9BILA|nr:hypothetical protein Y032_0632g877 [Ancylostoma ceylanicum]
MLPAISHTNTMLSFVIFLAVISFGEAVSLSLVRVACARDPTLPFCDSHILGDPITSTPKPLVTTPRLSAALGLDKKLPGYDKEQQQQFLTWLSDQKDEVPDADIDTEELESSHHVHSDVGEYCMKYKANFHHYCKNGNVDKLEGVLPQFCTVYGRHCGIDDFPKPGPLLESKEQFKEETAKQPSGSFKGSTTEYCGKFLEQYNQLCSAGGKSTKAEEFCSSYKQSCNKSAAKPNSDLAKEIEDIDDFPEPAGVGGGAPPSEEEEENETTKKPQVARYCDKYWENYNFYCAGESSADHEKFCRSYRSNCPQKVGSLKESASFLGGKGKVVTTQCYNTQVSQREHSFYDLDGVFSRKQMPWNKCRAEVLFRANIDTYT